MKLVSYNIQYGKGMDGVIDLVRSCRPIRGADIICLQEVDQCWKRSGDRDQAADIGGLMPSYYRVFGSSFDVDASSRAAHGAIINRRRRHGNMILSRWPILSLRTFDLPKRHYSDKFNMQMSCLEAVIDTGALVLRVYNYHAAYLEAEERLQQIDCLAGIFARSPGEHGAWSGKADIDGDDWSNRRATPGMPQTALVCGDFNANPDSAEYRRLLELTGLVDCWSVADTANQRTATIKKQPSRDIRVYGKLDHIFVTPDLRPCIDSACIDHEADGSDHAPIRVELDLANLA